MFSPKNHIVLFTSEFPPLPGGIGTHAYNLAEHLSDEGYKVSVIADQRTIKASEAVFDTQLKSNVCRVSLTRPRFFMYVKRIWKTFKLSQSAEVLVCSGKFPLWVGAFLKPFIKSETIAIIHGTEVNFKRPKLRKSIDWSLKRFDKIIAVSNYTKSLVSGLKLKNIKVIPNGVSIGSWSSKSIQLKGSPRLLTVGNITERKGQLNVIKHLPNLIKHFPQIHYHCVGLKTEVDSCITLAKSLNVLDYVTFHGRVDAASINGFYQNSDICVMLSQETDTGDVEGFGIALLEANYFGLPTIGSKNCGIEDAISHEASGLLIAKENPKEFKSAIDNILNNKSHYSENAKAWAKLHVWTTVIKRYKDYIEE